MIVPEESLLLGFLVYVSGPFELNVVIFVSVVWCYTDSH